MKKKLIVKRILILFLLLVFFAKPFAQSTNFEIGYRDGLKNGYCYKLQTITCTYPITFIYPMPERNESFDNYQDGYNRGFQVGIDLQRIDNSLNINPNTDYYNNYKNIEHYKPSEYIEPVDLSLLRTVNERKQKLFYENANWVEQRYNRLSDLNITALKETSPKDFLDISNTLHNYSITLSSGVDYSDQSVINQIANTFNELESRIRTAYNVHKPTLNNVDLEHKRRIKEFEKEHWMEKDVNVYSPAYSKHPFIVLKKGEKFKIVHWCDKSPFMVINLNGRICYIKCKDIKEISEEDQQ